jgi:hypothetical protein
MSQCEKNMVEPDRPELTMYNGTEKMWFSNLITKAKILIIVNSATKYFSARQECKVNTFLSFLGHSKHFCSDGSYIYANNNKTVNVRIT